MIKIALCDDEARTLEYYQTLITSIAKSKDMLIDTKAYQKVDTLLFDFIEEPFSFDVIFLDIHIDKANGIDVAKQIRKYNPNVLIIFLTNSMIDVFNAFEVQPFHYLIKIRDDKKFPLVITSIANHLKYHQEDFFLFQTSSKHISIPFDQIKYFSVNNRILSIHQSNTDYIEHFYGKLADIRNKITSHFVQINRSIILNILYIDKYVDDTIFLKTGEKLYLTESNRKAFIDVFNKHHRVH